MERAIRNSAKAVLFHQGKLLALRLREGDEVWYILPGGGQRPDETLPEAVCREVAEETGIRVSCGQLAFVVEGVRGEAFHRVDLVFQCQYLSDIPGAALQKDTLQEGWEWLEVSRLNALPLYPSKLRRPIMDLYHGKAHPIYLGNEEVGDPECGD